MPPPPDACGDRDGRTTAGSTSAPPPPAEPSARTAGSASAPPPPAAAAPRTRPLPPHLAPPHPPPWRLVAAPYTGERHARGVVATVDLARGDVVDVAPALVFDRAAYAAAVRGGVLDRYVFADRASGGALLAVGGAGSMFNHSRKPNVDYRVRAADGAIAFVAARRVAAGEELCISYGRVWWEEEEEGEEARGWTPSHDHMDDEAAFLGAMALGGGDDGG